MRGDGNGWVECPQGHRHWGRYGAAGLLLYTVDDGGRACVLMQHRAEWTHNGGTWGIPGGARDSHEDAAEAALREAHEETSLDVAEVRVSEVGRDDHETWAYDTVLAHTHRPLDTQANDESADLAWTPVELVAELPLHPGFAGTWPSWQARPITVVVDAANVVGSQPFRYVPGGWWRDQVTATSALLDELVRLRGQVTRTSDGCLVVVQRVVAVVEGAARPAAGSAPTWLTVVAAHGSGDDAVVDESSSSDVLVVTADRGLRGRLAATVRVEGPAWLLTRCDATSGD